LARRELAVIASDESCPDEVTPGQIAIFTEFLRGILDGSDAERKKLYLRSIVSEIIVSDSEIIVLGDQSTLNDLISQGPSQIEAESSTKEDAPVRMYMDEWRSRQDSNL
jgi:hypothetical protein